MFLYKRDNYLSCFKTEVGLHAKDVSEQKCRPKSLWYMRAVNHSPPIQAATIGCGEGGKGQTPPVTYWVNMN